MKCRFCGTSLSDVFLDLGTAPPSNAFLTADDLKSPEVWLPLKLFTCPECFLVQVDEVQSRERLFSPDYVYFSSYSQSWLEHARRYVTTTVPRLGLGSNSLVVEIASNDGYLLQYVQERGIPCIGIEPTANTAAASRKRGIDTIEGFFGESFAQEFANIHGESDLIIGNNVLAHVPDINDFVAGLPILLKSEGVVSIEFPHLLELVRKHQFDTVYHEHFSYLSFHTVCRIFAAHGLCIWDVQPLPTHGGSLRVWACLSASTRAITPVVTTLLAEETSAGMQNMSFYRGFQQIAETVKNDLLRFLLDQKQKGSRVVGYGAAAKGNTLLNFAGVRADLLEFVVDASPHKQGRFLPGSRIPVVVEKHLRTMRPDFVLVLPWNLRDEIVKQLAYIKHWGGQFVFAVPALEVGPS